MKISHTILALLVAGSLSHGAFGSDNTNGPLALAIVPDGHGGSHFIYYQTYSQQDTTSVALTANSATVTDPPPVQGPPQADNGQVRYVIGTNQHAQANAAYIPLTSHFAQATQ